jgi:uncharacterized LabA/DUF88 family protein
LGNLQEHNAEVPFLVQYKNGKIRGNDDAELVLHAMIDIQNYEKAVIVSGDGDFHCLINVKDLRGER